MSLKPYFLLEPEVIFLNHGSFGATPIPVMEALWGWQERLERQPVRFLGREVMVYLETARERLGEYLHAPPADLAFIPNVTHGLNLIARALPLNPGVEVLTTTHEYGACNFVWEFIARKTGAKVVRHDFGLPLMPPDEFVYRLWEKVSPSTKVIFLSHITSPTAQRFPVEQVCRKARDAGILTIIDGAHAPGQIPLDLRELAADFYLGNCHKWMLGPKGSGFLYTRPERQPMIEPLVVSWGWGPDYLQTAGSRYLDFLQWSGTQSPAAYLAVPDAIEFQAANDWPAVRARCRRLLAKSVTDLSELTGLPSVYPNDFDRFSQMAVVPLPEIKDPQGLQAALYDRYHIEIPIIQWGDRHFIRLSIQGYNVAADLDALVHALTRLLPIY